MTTMTDNAALNLLAQLMTADNQHTHHEAFSHIAARLREPAGVIEFSEKHGIDLRGIKVGEVLTQDQWNAVCVFVRDQEVIIEDRDERLRALTQPPAEAQAQGGGEVCEVCDGGPGNDGPCLCGLNAPPSAPVGVEGLQRWSMARGSVYIDHDPEGEWVKWSDVQLAGLTTALAQQPAAVDGAMKADAEELALVAKERGLDDPLAQRILSVRTRVLAAAFRAAQPGGSDNGR